jgi:Zn-finger nucleic acid-binding protein
MALACPQCTVAMKEVKATTTSGYLLALDQCPRCGGIWTDRWEVFPLSTAAVERLDSVDTVALQASQAPGAAMPPALQCPRCRARMRQFNDPTLPPDVRIERCLNCEGMWFNRGELRRFKIRSGTPAASPNAVELDRLVQAASATGALPTVSHLDDAMRAAPDGVPNEVRQDLAAGAVWLVVRTALRLLFHI